MAELAESSSSIQPKVDKPVIVRVKRKAFLSPLEAFWLEINERPLKRSLLDFEKLSISDSSKKAKKLASKKVFVQHVETFSSSEVTAHILQSFMESNSSEALGSKGKIEVRRHAFRTENKHNQLLIKAKEKQEFLAKNARFEQIWRSRKGKKQADVENFDEVCRLYDVVRVDVEETIKEVQKEDAELKDHKLMYSYLPLLREFIPSAAEEIESDIHDYFSKRDDYVYDYYAVNHDMDITAEDAANPFPLVQVDDEDEFNDGPDDSEYESDDSNAENNPLNDYPDEEISEDDEAESRTSAEASEHTENESISGKSSEATDVGYHNRSYDADLFFESELDGDDDIEVCDYDDKNDDFEKWR